MLVLSEQASWGSPAAVAADAVLRTAKSGEHTHRVCSVRVCSVCPGCALPCPPLHTNSQCVRAWPQCTVQGYARLKMDSGDGLCGSNKYAYYPRHV